MCPEGGGRRRPLRTAATFPLRKATLASDSEPVGLGTYPVMPLRTAMGTRVCMSGTHGTSSMIFTWASSYSRVRSAWSVVWRARIRRSCTSSLT